MGSNSNIKTEFHVETDPVDDGVDREIVAEEEFDFHGEPIERETELAILDDGGVSIIQEDNQCPASMLTLGSDVVKRLVEEVGDE